jgi:hypothetical protein
MAALIGLGFLLLLCALVGVAYGEFSRQWPEYKDGLHSVIAGTVIAIFTLGFAPWVTAIVLVGSSWLFVLWSRTTRAREHENLLEWKRLAERELSLTVEGCARPWYEESTYVFVMGRRGDLTVKVGRHISGSDLGPSSCYFLETERGGDRRSQEFDGSLNREQAIQKAKELLNANDA